jgi:hypothetical protein
MKCLIKVSKRMSVAQIATEQEKRTDLQILVRRSRHSVLN